MFDNQFYDAPKSDVVPDKVAKDIVVTDGPTISPDSTCKDAVEVFKSNPNAQFLPMVDSAGILRGLMSTMSLSTFLLNGGASSANVKDAEIPVFRKLTSDTSLNIVRFSLDVNGGVVVIGDVKDGNFVYSGIITANTLFNACAF